MYPRLSELNFRHALRLWYAKSNTDEIAKHLGVEEAAVANSLGAEFDRRHREKLNSQRR